MYNIQFNRLSATERNEYLRKLLGENDSESSELSDSEDEDWIPRETPANIARRQTLNQKDNSEHEDSESDDTEEIAEENLGQEEEEENSESEDVDNEVETAEPEGSKIFVLNNN